MSTNVPGRASLRYLAFSALCVLAIGVVTAGAASAAEKVAVSGKSRVHLPSATAAVDTGINRQRLTRDGLVIDFSVKPVLPEGDKRQELIEGDVAEIAFRITDAATKQGVPALYPAGWVDITKTAKGATLKSATCKDRAALYMQGIVGMRPMLDLNSYFVMVMNHDATISVIDPIVGVTGITKLYTQIILPRPGEDWAKTRNEKRMFVSMPRADAVAVLDTDSFKLTAVIPAGKTPMRTVLQPDEKYLWVGNNARNPKESGVTVIDAETLKVVKHIKTGDGHHEIAFVGDSSKALVTNRKAGNVSVIDVATLSTIKDIKIGSAPLSATYSNLSKLFYVTEGVTGTVLAINPEKLEVTRRIALRPGIGPVRSSPDGRWIMAVNTKQNVLHIIDAATNVLVHDIKVGEKPFSVSFTRAYAYVRALGSERVSMIELGRIGGKNLPPVLSFGAGAKAPGKAANLSLAEPVVEAAGEAAVLVASPADQTVYYYMEGMNAPMGQFRNYGHRPRAVQVVDRTLQESPPGYYASKVKIPAAGEFTIAFLLDSPRVLHCFSFAAKVNPLLKRQQGPLTIEYLDKPYKVKPGEKAQLRFALLDSDSGARRTGLRDVRIRFYRAPAFDRTEVVAIEKGEGVYEAALPIPNPGAYYVYVAAPSARLKFADLPYITLLAARDHTQNMKRGPLPAKSR